MRKIIKNIILFLIELIEKYEYRNMSLDEDDISKKIIDTIDISNDNLKVLSHDGYHPITHIHKTQPYRVYTLTLESGDKLECADNHIVFCEGFVQKFVKDLTKDDFVITKNGLSKVKSVEKSKFKVSMYDVTVDSEEHSYFGNNILSHNTVIAAIFILHYIIFNFDRHVAIAANKYATATEIMDKIKEMMNYLPFFMKPGVKVNNISKMSFANGCRIEAQSTTKRSFIGYTIHLLYLDEFAHVEPHILDEFYENIMPTVSSMEDSKIIVTSTPNGYNKFFDLYQGAVDGKNSYHPIRVDWWQVPGRDEKWKEKMIFDCGGEDEFMRQYGNSFLSTGNTLLSPDSLAKLQKNRVKYIYRTIPELEMNWDEEWSNLKWHPDFDVSDLKNPKYCWVMSIDLAEGGGGDSSILNIFRLQTKPKELIAHIDVKSEDYVKSDFFQFVQVGRFKSNTIDITKLAKLVNILTPKVINPDKIRIVCEYNAFGGEFIMRLQNVFGDKNEFDISTVLKFKHSDDATTRKYGLKIRVDNKPIMCIKLKGLVASDGIIVTDDDTVGEFEVFSRVGNSWKATRDNDDLAMSTVNLTSIYDHPYLDVMMEEVMYEEGNEEIAKLFEMKLDEKFSNVYDNNDFMNDKKESLYQPSSTDLFSSLYRSKNTLYS